MRQAKLIVPKSELWKPGLFIPRRSVEAFIGGPVLGLRGRVENMLVLNADGSVAQETGPFENLILDSGLDMLCNTQMIANCFSFCRAGTGTAAPAITNTLLQAQVASTNTYLGGAGNSGTTNPNAWTFQMQRTYDFARGAINANVGELGFGFDPSGPLFSRVLVQSGGVPTVVTVTPSQQLRVVYTLTVTLAPSVHTAASVSITGWGTVPGNHALQALTNAISTVAGGGGSSWGDPDLEPSSARQAFVSIGAQALAPVGSFNARPETFHGTTVNAAYTAGSFFRDRDLSMTIAQGVGTLWSCGLGRSGATAGTNHSYAFVFNAGQVKANTHTLRLGFRLTVARA